MTRPVNLAFCAQQSALHQQRGHVCKLNEGHTGLHRCCRCVQSWPAAESRGPVCICREPHWVIGGKCPVHKAVEAQP